MNTSGIILAGGKSLRLGRNKAFEVIGHKNLLDLVIERLAFLTDEIILVTAAEQKIARHKEQAEFKVVADSYPGRGPLGGVYTGLEHSESSYSIVVASDMPFLNQALLRYMREVSTGFDIVVPRAGELVEPLHAVYSKRCMQPIKQMIDKGQLSIHQLFPLVSTRYLEMEEIERFDPRHLSFFNINTLEDLKRAKEIALELQP